MTIDPATLPDDIDALKRLVLEQYAKLTAHSIEIERLKLLIAKLRRLQFGRSSEKVSHEIEQLNCGSRSCRRRRPRRCCRPRLL